MLDGLVMSILMFQIVALLSFAFSILERMQLPFANKNGAEKQTIASAEQ
jgi:hypothetical protein